MKSMTRSDKLAFLYLKGWTEYEWKTTFSVSIETIKSAFFKTIKETTVPIYQNVIPEDFAVDFILLVNPRTNQKLHSTYYSVEHAYEMETDA